MEDGDGEVGQQARREQIEKYGQGKKTSTNDKTTSNKQWGEKMVLFSRLVKERSFHTLQ